MNESPQEPSEPEGSSERPRPGQLGIGTVALLAVFLAIIAAMCLGAAVIMAVLIFK